MKLVSFFLWLGLLPGALASVEPQPRLLTTVRPLPVVLDPSFQFRKTKIFELTERAPALGKQKITKTGEQVTNAATASKSTSVAQAASITFERDYRLFGAVTNLDKRQRYGNYFDFFWRAKRPANLTVRFEYRQAQLHAHVQAQELNYASIKGTHRSEFRVIGDDYLDGGKVIAWRCSLIENGHIVAENRSFLWE